MVLLDRGIASKHAVYVGDTLKDWACASELGIWFIGANYGFEDLKAANVAVPLANELGEVGLLLKQEFGV